MDQLGNLFSKLLSMYIFKNQGISIKLLLNNNKLHSKNDVIHMWCTNIQLIKL